MTNPRNLSPSIPPTTILENLAIRVGSMWLYRRKRNRHGEVFRVITITNVSFDSISYREGFGRTERRRRIARATLLRDYQRMAALG